MTQRSWINKISNACQLGGIETSVLDNGAGKGTRIAWINTGTGLRYKIVIDRALDIADCFFNQHSLAWISRSGISPPQPLSNKGIDWLKTFGGGLMVTCGLDHVGGPESDEFGDRGLHGPVSNIAAEIESIIQPDPAAGNLQMSITGIIRQSRIFGPELELKRTISGTLGSATISIHDQVTNRGNSAAPHMLLYHCNFGWPLADEGTEILWEGPWQSREAAENRKLFLEENDFHRCPPPLDDHSGSGEEAAFIDIESNDNGLCICGLYNEKLNWQLRSGSVKISYHGLQTGSIGERENMLPGSNPAPTPPVGQARARAMQQLIQLQPGESRSYNLEVEVYNDDAQISRFLESIRKTKSSS